MNKSDLALKSPVQELEAFLKTPGTVRRTEGIFMAEAAAVLVEYEVATRPNLWLVPPPEEDQPTPEISAELGQQRLLSDVDQINRLRLPDGGHVPSTFDGVVENLVPAVKEAVIPNAVSTTYQRFRDGDFYWLDIGSEEAAASGYSFHFSQPAFARVDVEVAEMRDVRYTLKPGVAKVMLSPKMTRVDATYDLAKEEHLGDDDMIRIHVLDVDEQTGETRGKYMESVLVRDIPHEAWVAMVKDPNNVFGRSFELENEVSALPIMKLHDQLSVSVEDLPEGVISLVEAVKPYCDEQVQASLDLQLLLLRGDQEVIHKKAESIAVRWLAFEVDLADSLFAQQATSGIEQFIAELSDYWSDDFNELLQKHINSDGSITMTRELAGELERSKRNVLWIKAAVVNNNQAVIKELGTARTAMIYENEMLLQQRLNEGATISQIRTMEAGNDRNVASANLKLDSRGCPGSNEGAFKNPNAADASKESNESCVIKTNCPNCSGLKEDGTKGKGKVKVTAIIDASKTIHCKRCGAWAAPNGKADTGRIARLAKQRATAD